MPGTFLWLVSNRFKVYLLSSQGQQWEELPRSDIELKRVSAVNRFAWALGADHQIYLYVVASEIPIRCKEDAYENQRWNPNSGFCDLLLPTDRPHWSSQDGLINRQRENIKLPSDSWAWENDWMIEDNLDGQPLGHEGWMYAFDFPMEFRKDKKMSSFVRRRRWFRYRDFVAVNKWIVIPGICADPFLESFVDVSVGGLEVPGVDGDIICVWAVTIQGRVMFRQGVTFNNPEGNGWVHIATPSDCEIINISVGPSGLVWVLTENGKGLARTGVVRQKLTGSGWVEVSPPAEDCNLTQVSVGLNAVWAVSNDNSIWFRKGICGNESGTNIEAARGSGWVQMCGKMSVVTVGPNDQVWAIKKDEPNVVCFRTGVTLTDVGGKTWKPIILPVKHRTDSTEGFAVDENRVSEAIDLPNVICEADSGICVNSRSDAEATEDVDLSHTLKQTKSSETTVQNSSGSDTSSPQLCRSDVSSTQESLLATEDEFFEDSEISFEWSWISGSACYIDPLQIPNWFQSNFLTNTTLLGWRNLIGTELSTRRKREMISFKYEDAVEKVAWKKIGRGLVWVNNRWIECRMELEQINCEDGEDSVLSVFYNKEIIKIDLNYVTCVTTGSEQNRHLFNVYVKPNDKSNVTLLRLAFFSDTELEDWIAVTSSACCEIAGFTNTPSASAIWATTTRGDIFAHNPITNIDHTPRLNEIFWRQFGGHLKIIETCTSGVVWGLGYNYSPSVYTGGWGGGFFKGFSSSSFGLFSIMDTRQMYIYENQRWNPLTGFSARGLPTDRYMWSDSTGKFECTKENTRLPSMHWQWGMDWAVDYHTPGGVDKEGWQYAKDFPCSFHARKGLTDYVRRRRWYRRCKLTTSGPWEVLESVALVDISFQVSPLQNEGDCIATWAVDRHGNALYRHGVTIKTPRGTHWEHVKGDSSYCSVSVGTENRVWVVSRDGSAYLRNSITASNLTGSMWLHVEPPNVGINLQQISVGDVSIWAVDTNGGLWYRENVMPMFPEGTNWKYVCDEVHKVSVGPDDQVWVIAKSVNASPVPLNGVICRRKNITKEDKIGSGWEYGPGGGWNHVSARGCNVYSSPKTS